MCLGVCTHVQDFRAFNRTGKPRVLIMSYPCFRGHKAEVYKLGIDVLMCDEVCVLSEIDCCLANSLLAQCRYACLSA